MARLLAGPALLFAATASAPDFAKFREADAARLSAVVRRISKLE